jgi:DNA-binding transcriptional MerR regulator
MGDEWTIAELAERVAAALDGIRAPSGRVTVQPDERMIRWYATIGLVDRPHGFRGRTALYGRRHLLQLAAIKRRQAEGRSLAEIQAELAGATDDTLAGVAGLGAAPAARSRFWVDRPGPAPAEPAATRPAAAGPTTAGPAAAGPAAAAPAEVLYAVPLHPAATLVLRAAPDHDDLAALSAAARPLLDALDARGLLTQSQSQRSQP